MTKLERLAHWKKLARDPSPTPWRSEEKLAGFFQQFRPHGKGLEQVFEGIRRGNAIIARLRDVYRCTADGYRANESYDGYFIVRKPRPLPTAITRDSVLQFLDKVRQIAKASRTRELVALLDPLPVITIRRGEAPWPPPDDSPETLIYETICDWVISLRPAKSPITLLEEAFYTIACDYYLSYHLLWPLYRNSTKIQEPFAPYFELWSHGIGWRFTNPKRVTAYVPALPRNATSR